MNANQGSTSGDSLPAGLIGGVERRTVRLQASSPRWPADFAAQARVIRAALGAAARRIEHIGSTSVPGLAAKPIIDLLLVVEDSSEETSYLPALEQAGYQLRVREPEANEHRMFRTPDLSVHVHVYSTGSAEIDRYLVFRDRLRRNTNDRRRYEAAKRALAARDWPDMNAYAAAKSEVVESIIEAGFRDLARDC